MKRLSRLITIAMLLLFVSCRQQDSELKYFTFRTEKTDFWGMMSTRGEVIADGKFMYPPGCAWRGVFLAREDDGMYAFYKTDDFVSRLNAERYVMAQPFRYGDYTAVCCEGDTHLSILDIEGRVVATLPDSIVDIGLFSENMAPVRVDDYLPRMGYVDIKGEVVIPPRYTVATNFVCGVALVEEVVNGFPIWSVINPRGEILYRFDKELRPLASEYSDGLLSVINVRGEIGFLDTQGKLLIKPSDGMKMCRPSNPATIPYTFKSGRAVYSDGKKYGLIDKRGNIIVPAKYRNIYLGEGGLFAAEDMEYNWGCIDADGNIVIPFEHLPGVIRPSITPHVIVMQNEAQRYRLIDNRGEVISRPFENYQIK